MRDIGIRIAMLFIVVSMIVCVLFEYNKTKEVTPLEVVDKCEVDGKCYVETWIEVTPEDYIGLDIGDEFERSVEK